MERIFHNYLLWEDWKDGMWRKLPPTEEPDFIDKAIEFTGDHEKYGSWMMEVAKKWPIACEHNLTNLSQNRRAWIGHAACSMAINCPEYITRHAWGQLTQQQQDDANAMADRAIRWWEDNIYNQKQGSFEY